MQLHTGASGFGGNGCRPPAQWPRARDIDWDVLAAGIEDGVVECAVAGRFAHPVLREVPGHQRGQNADHHDVGAAGVRLLLGSVEAGPYLLFQLQAGIAGKRPGRHIELDIERAQFGLIGRVGDRVQHIPIRHGGLIVAVDQVALDLHAGERFVVIEAALCQHRLDDVDT